MPRKTSPTKRSNGKPPETAQAPAPEPERVTRPDLPRTEPIRSWTTLFNAKSAPARAESAYASGARNGANAVQRGVELGYRVMDEYLRQGTVAADAFSARTPQAFPVADLPQMGERMMRSMQDMSALWFEMMGVMMSNMPNAESNGARQPAAAHSTPWAPPGRAHEDDGREPATGRWRVAVRVDSSRATEVTVTLDDGQHATGLAVEPLRAASGRSHIDATLELSEESSRVVRLHASVAADVPADRYTGVVLDRTSGSPVGRVTIEVLA